MIWGKSAIGAGWRRSPVPASSRSELGSGSYSLVSLRDSVFWLLSVVFLTSVTFPLSSEGFG